MTDKDLQRLAYLCQVIDHLELHGNHNAAQAFISELDATIKRIAQGGKKGKTNG